MKLRGSWYKIIAKHDNNSQAGGKTGLFIQIFINQTSIMDA